MKNILSYITEYYKAPKRIKQKHQEYKNALYKITKPIENFIGDYKNKKDLDDTIYNIVSKVSKPSAKTIAEDDRDFTLFDFLNGLLEQNADQIYFTDITCRTKTLECVWRILDKYDYNSISFEDIEAVYMYSDD